jgi:hypothetical protein
MPVLQIDDRHIPLPDGTTRLGTGGNVDVALPGDPSLGAQAVIVVAADQRVAISRAADDALVRVNGVALGAEPTPLLHGDRVEIGGRELRFVEDSQAGQTRYVSANEMAALAGRGASPARPTRASGGRLVSLLDGKEYLVGETGLRIGRDAGCDVVVPLGEVSRHHAEIVPAERGYLLRDLSTNGVLVNGTRVDRSQLLGRGDVLRVGAEEFRFYADVALPVPSGPVTAPVSAPAAPPSSPVAPSRQGGGAAASAPAVGAPALAPAGSVAPAVATRASHPAAAELAEQRRRRGLPVWVWVLAVLLVAAGTFFVLQGRP